MASATLTLHPLSGTIGAEVAGVHLADDLDPGAITALREALVERKVLVLRDQFLPGLRPSEVEVREPAAPLVADLR